MRKLLQVSLLSLLLGSPAFAAKNAGQPLDKVVVVLNSSVITQSELDEAMDKVKNQLAASHTPTPPGDVLKKQVLDQLINRKLQIDLAEQNNVQVTDEDVDKAINIIASRNHITTDQLYEGVASQGMDRAQYRKELHDEIIIQKIQQEAVASKINITPQEVDDFMRSAAWQAHNTREYHLEDILIALPENPSPQDINNAKNRANGLLTKLHQGVSFREIAVSESGDGNALQGGDLGWRKLPEIPSAFANPILQANANDIIGPIQTANGFHIIHIAGVRKINDVKMTAENKKQQIQQLLFQRKFEEALQSWLTKIRSESFINTHPEA